MSRFRSAPVALLYAFFVAMGVVAVLSWTGRLPADLAERLVPPLFLSALALAGLWQYRLNRRSREEAGDEPAREKGEGGGEADPPR